MLNLHLPKDKIVFILSLILLGSFNSYGQLDFERIIDRSEQEFPEKIGGSRVTFFDWKNDGDLDLVTAVYRKDPIFYENVDGRYRRIYSNALDNPFERLSSVPDGHYSMTFGDLDGDGIEELLIGDTWGNLDFHKMINGIYVQQFGDNNPFNGLKITNRGTTAAYPTFGDVDNDGDLDLVVGDAVGDLHFLRNDLDTFSIISNNPFNKVHVGLYNIYPQLIDIDDDGMTDLLYSTEHNEIDSAHVFVLYGKDRFEFDYREKIYSNYPEWDVFSTVEDLNNDGLLDLIISDSPVRYISDINGASELQTNWDSPFSGFSNPYGLFKSIDWDKDGDKDVFIATYFGVEYRENVEGQFFLKEGDDNPLRKVSVSDLYVSFEIEDIDGDNDYDVVCNGTNSQIQYFLNVGDSLVKQSDDDNPFLGIELNTDGDGDFKLIDIDFDGDMDVMLNDNHTFPNQGELQFYENVNNTFIEKTGINNPFDSIAYFGVSNLYDWDDDGDLDLIVMSNYSSVLSSTPLYFENQDGKFRELKDDDNPFYSFSPYVLPACFDFLNLNDDGKVDLLIWDNSYGSVEYLNIGSVTVDGLEDNKELERLLIYPNPTSSKLVVEGQGDFEIFSVLGNSVLKGAYETEINVSSLEKGVYLLKTDRGTNSFIKN